MVHTQPERQAHGHADHRQCQGLAEDDAGKLPGRQAKSRADAELIAAFQHRHEHGVQQPEPHHHEYHAKHDSAKSTAQPDNLR